MYHSRFSENENETVETHIPRHQDSKTKKPRHWDSKTKKPRHRDSGTETPRHRETETTKPSHFLRGRKTTTSGFQDWKTTTSKFQDHKATTWSFCGILALNIQLTQFVIFEPLSYCFEETIKFDVKVSYASCLLSRLIKWYNKPGDATKEFWEKVIQFHGTFHGLKITNWIRAKWTQTGLKSQTALKSRSVYMTISPRQRADDTF